MDYNNKDYILSLIYEIEKTEERINILKNILTNKDNYYFRLSFFKKTSVNHDVDIEIPVDNNKFEYTINSIISEFENDIYKYKNELKKL